MLLEKEIVDAENKITELETEIAAFEQELSTPEGAKNVELLQTYLETKAKLDKTMSCWEELTLALEEKRALLQ